MDTWKKGFDIPQNCIIINKVCDFTHKTKRQKNKNTKSQKHKKYTKTKIHKDKNTHRQKRQRLKRKFNIVMSGQTCNVFFKFNIWHSSPFVLLELVTPWVLKLASIYFKMESRTTIDVHYSESIASEEIRQIKLERILTALNISTLKGRKFIYRFMIDRIKI